MRFATASFANALARRWAAVGDEPSAVIATTASLKESLRAAVSL